MLMRYRQSPIIIFMHHPPFSVGLDWFEPMLLRAHDAAAFWRIVAAAGNVRHIAFGHLHMNVTGVINGISFSASRGSCHKIATSSATGATYVDAPPAFDVFLIDGEGIRVHSVDAFGPDRIIARERATPDGKGEIDLVGPW